jgi:outer membrane protein assembly factor BamB
MKSVSTATCILLTAGFALGSDWPQWLGPKRNGGTSETVAAWTEKPPVLWREMVGSGFASPVVSGGRVFLHAGVAGKEEEEVIALDAVTGKIVWRESYPRPEFKSVLGTGPRATPTVAGKRVYSMGINGLLTCFDAADGKRIWQADVYKQFKADLPTFAVCCSPLVVGNRVIVSVGGKGHCVVAFRAETGEVEWQALDDAASTSSPVLFAGGARGVGAAPDVVFMTPLRIVALDPLDGAVRWQHPMIFQPQGTSPTPIAVGDRLIASTQAHGALAVRVEEKDDKIAASESWQMKDAKSYFSSGVASSDRLYLVTNKTEIFPSASITCIDAAAGTKLWTKNSVGYFHAGVIRLGDGKLLVLNDSGTLSLLDVNDKGATELATARVCGGTLSSPALANGRLYLRDDKELICLQLAEGKSP